MAPHSTLAWKIPWTEEPGGLQSMGLLRVRHNGAISPKERGTLPHTLPSALDPSSPVLLDELSFGYQHKAQDHTP